MAIEMSGTVAVIGGSYVGLRLARQLASKLPASHKVVLIENNTHFHHLFTFPRFAVLQRGGEEKAFVPYNHVLTSPHSVMHAKVNKIDPAQKTLFTESGDSLRYDVLALATGTRLETPWNINIHGKSRAVTSLQDVQDRVNKAQRVVIVGGGAVGVQVAFDVRQLYPEKQVVVVHSRTQIMNKFHKDLHELVTTRFAAENIETVLGSRVNLPPQGYPDFTPGKQIDVQLQNGTTVNGDLVLLCTGQTPRSDLLAPFKDATTPSGFIRVKPTMQTPQFENIFAVGDVADSGAPKTVRAALGQIDTATHNILSMLGLQNDGLKTFTSGPAGIHLTLGLKESVKFGNPPADTPDAKPRCLVEEDGALDMHVARMWTNLNVPEGSDWNS